MSSSSLCSTGKGVSVARPSAARAASCCRASFRCCSTLLLAIRSERKEVVSLLLLVFSPASRPRALLAMVSGRIGRPQSGNVRDRTTKSTMYERPLVLPLACGLPQLSARPRAWLAPAEDGTGSARVGQQTNQRPHPPADGLFLGKLPLLDVRKLTVFKASTGHVQADSVWGARNVAARQGT